MSRPPRTPGPRAGGRSSSQGATRTSFAGGLTILDAIGNPEIWAPWFKLAASWSAWLSFLRVLFGLPLSRADVALFKRCTGRTLAAAGAFFEAWLICGRRA